MKTVRSLLASAIAAAATLGFVALSTPAQADRELVVQGVSTQGVSMQGVSMQGVTLPGISIQGTRANGAQSGRIAAVSLPSGEVEHLAQ